MKIQNVITTLSLVLLTSVSWAKEVTVNKNMGMAMDNLHAQMVDFKATDRFNDDFMTIYDGMKEDNWEYPQEIYTKAIENALWVASEGNMLPLILKNVKRPLNIPAADQTIAPRKRTDAALLENSSCCGDCTLITQADFPAPGVPFFIGAPGKYCFAEDITFTPATPADLGIIIGADNVTIDMCGHKFQQDGATQALTAVSGFFLLDDHKNITIKNGTICNFQGSAITGITSLSVFGSTLDTLCFSDLTITDNGDGTQRAFDESFGNLSHGINLFSLHLGFFGPEIKNVRITNCKINRNTLRGIFIAGGDNIIIENTSVNSTFVDLREESFRSLYSIELFECNNVVIDTCQANSVTDNDTSSFSLLTQSASLGIFTNSTNIAVRNSQFNNTFGIQDPLIAGVTLDNSGNSNISFEKCQCNNSAGGPKAGRVGGLFAHCKSSSFTKCQFNGASHEPGISESDFVSIGGVFIAPAFTPEEGAGGVGDILFDECQVAHLISDNPAIPVYGYQVLDIDEISVSRDMQNITFRNCVASDLSGAVDVFGYSCVISPNLEPAITSNIVFENCIAEGISSTSDTSLVNGFSVSVNRNREGTILPLENLYIRDCRVSDIKGGSDDLSAGIFVESTLRPVLCTNSVSDCVNGIFLAGTEKFGFTQCSLIQDNKVDNCSLSGYRDDRCPTNSAFIANTAFKNGTPSTHKANYDINWSQQAPVSEGTLNKYPNCKSRLSNASIIPGKDKCKDDHSHSPSHSHS